MEVFLHPTTLDITTSNPDMRLQQIICRTWQM